MTARILARQQLERHRRVGAAELLLDDGVDGVQTRTDLLVGDGGLEEPPQQGVHLLVVMDLRHCLPLQSSPHPAAESIVRGAPLLRRAPALT